MFNNDQYSDGTTLYFPHVALAEGGAPQGGPALSRRLGKQITCQPSSARPPRSVIVRCTADHHNGAGSYHVEQWPGQTRSRPRNALHGLVSDADRPAGAANRRIRAANACKRAWRAMSARKPGRIVDSSSSALRPVGRLQWRRNNRLLLDLLSDGLYRAIRMRFFVVWWKICCWTGRVSNRS